MNIANKTASSTKKQLYIITLIVGLGFLGISLPYPIFAPMIMHNVNGFLGEHPLYAARVMYLGLLLCAYPLGQCCGSAILGALSDCIGRKHTLIFSLIGTCFGYILSGIAILIGGYSSLFLARTLTGFCEGNIAIAQAAAADLSRSFPKSTSFSLINCAVAISYTIGPLLGGSLTWMREDTAIGYALPFIMAAVLSLGSAIVVHYFFEETLFQGLKSRTLSIFMKLKQQLQHDFSRIIQVLTVYPIRKAIFIFLLFYSSIDLFYEFYPLFLVGKWAFSPIQIAFFSTVYTLPYALSQIYFVPYFSKTIQPVFMLKYVSLLTATLLLLLIIPDQYQSLYFSLPLLGIAMSFCSTNTAVFVSDSSDQKSQGTVMGTAQALRVFNIAIITVLGGLVGTFNITLPLFLSSVLMFIASYFVVYSFDLKMQKSGS